MNMNTLLDVEIEELFEELANLKKDTKEYADVESKLTTLMDRRIEIEKIKESASQAEKQMKEDRKARLAKNLIDVGSIVLPLAVTIWGAKASFRFEEEGTITTAIGRKFMDKLIKK
jgi:hypothetical protein